MEILCPKPPALTAIPAQDCPVDFNQVIRMAFQRSQPAASPYFVDGTKPMGTLASWTPALTAADVTKIILSPFFAGFVIPQSEEQVEGGNDNTTINGMEIYKGEGFVKVTWQMESLKPEVYEALKKLSAESIPSLGIAGLTVYLFNNQGQIISKDNAGIPVFNFRISTVGSEGLNARNKYNCSFTLPGNWDEGVTVSTPAFNPLIELVEA